jgi:hypothetical protein
MKELRIRDVRTTDREREKMRNQMRRRRAKHGWTSLQVDLDIDAAACLLYLQKQWGFPSRRVAVQVSLQYLAKQTRLGLREIKLGFDPED